MPKKSTFALLFGAILFADGSSNSSFESTITSEVIGYSSNGLYDRADDGVEHPGKRVDGYARGTSMSDDGTWSASLAPLRVGGVSRRLSELSAKRDRTSPFEARQTQRRHKTVKDSSGRRFGTFGTKVQDALSHVSQFRAGPSPSPILVFEGVSNVNNVLPPDVDGAVGPDHYVQVVNRSISVFEKSGAVLVPPVNTNTLWASFGGACESDNSGDAITSYDKYANRFVVVQFASSGVSICVAVSEGADPTGSYRLYEVPAYRRPDYTKLGVWPGLDGGAYVLTTNSGFAGGYDIYVLDRGSMIRGLLPSPAINFRGLPNFLMPADHEGGRLPSDDRAALLYTFRDGGEPYFGTPPPVVDSIDLYRIDFDWNFPESSTLTMEVSLEPPELAEFNWTVCGFFVDNCLAQPNGAPRLDSLSWWPMQRFVYRNFGTYESAVGTWTVDVSGQGDHAAPRWFELRKPHGTWNLFQQGTHAPDTAHRWMPSVGSDAVGNIALVYNIVDEGEPIFPSIRYAGRDVSDPPGTLRAESTLVDGEGTQENASGRWGDYSSMEVDPTDDCTLWMAGEYVRETGDRSWNTKIGAVRFESCSSVRATPMIRGTCAASGAAGFEVALGGNHEGPASLALDGCPMGATCDFSKNPILPGSGSYLSVDGLELVSAGDYPMTITSLPQMRGVGGTVQTELYLRVSRDLLIAPELSFPDNGTADVSTVTRAFSWSLVDGQAAARFELATDSQFVDLVESVEVQGDSYLSSVELESHRTYYWRVVANNECGDSPPSQTFSLTTGTAPHECPTGTVPVAYKKWNFDQNDGGFVALGEPPTWFLTALRPRTPPVHWHAGGISSEGDQQLLSPTINLPKNRQPLTLQYWNNRDLEYAGLSGCFDGGVLDISIDGGETFSPIEPGIVMTDPYTGPLQENSILAGRPAWCGSTPYVRTIVNLGQWEGQSADFKFRLISDEGTGGAGWSIDDILIQGCAPDPIWQNGFD